MSQKTQERATLAKKILQAVQGLQSKPGEWVMIGRLSNPLHTAGVEYKKLLPLLQEFQDILEFRNTGLIHYTRPKVAPVTALVKKNDVSVSQAQRNQSALAKKILQIVKTQQTQPQEWVNLAKLGKPLRDAGLRYSNLTKFLEGFRDVLDLKLKTDGNMRLARPKVQALATPKLKPVPVAPTISISKSKAILVSTASTAKPTVASNLTANTASTSTVAATVSRTSTEISNIPDLHVETSCPAITANDRNDHSVELTTAETLENTTSCRAIVTTSTDNATTVHSKQNTPGSDKTLSTQHLSLYDWAAFPSVDDTLSALSKLAISERWDYPCLQPQEPEPFPILRQYLDATFNRLRFEDKILFAHNEQDQKDYAAFNTGLVDYMYSPIYALFEKNSCESPRWSLDSFVVVGEAGGKVLVSLFNPLPLCANYFFIHSIGADNSEQEVPHDIAVDFKHILIKRTERLPMKFLKDACLACETLDFLCIDGMTLDEATLDNSLQWTHRKKSYFEKLGAKIEANSKIFRRMKVRLDEAVRLTERRVAWDPRTVIPSYNMRQNKVVLLLPLNLTDYDARRIADLALVVERQPSGLYQGHTLLPLNFAYAGARTIRRPMSDWLICP